MSEKERLAQALRDGDQTTFIAAVRRANASSREGVRMMSELREALTPFADFADRHNVVPAAHVITQGSPLAKRQLTMGDCYNARAALAATPAEIDVESATDG